MGMSGRLWGGVAVSCPGLAVVLIAALPTLLVSVVWVAAAAAIAGPIHVEVFTAALPRGWSARSSRNLREATAATVSWGVTELDARDYPTYPYGVVVYLVRRYRRECR